MSDNDYPSGPWTGFYNYSPGDKHRMDLHLQFADGSLSGGGNDDVGRFLIRGRYDGASRECHWTKTYPGSHDVIYRGFREGKGIWGTWEIETFAHGGFHIWPKGEKQGEEATATAEAVAQVETTVEDQGALARAFQRPEPARGRSRIRPLEALEGTAKTSARDPLDR